MKYRHVAVGGSFDVFHRGHKALLEKALKSGRYVTIGITSDAFSSKIKASYTERKSIVQQYLERAGTKEYTLIELTDPFGPTTTDETMEAIVVSEETYPRALEINRIREKKGLKKLSVITISMVLAEDGGSLSSSRIRKGEIDAEGTVRKG